VVKNVVRNLSIEGENYEGSIIPPRSDISRFSRGTIIPVRSDILRFSRGTEPKEVEHGGKVIADQILILLISKADEIMTRHS